MTANVLVATGAINNKHLSKQIDSVAKKADSFKVDAEKNLGQGAAAIKNETQKA